MQLTLWMPLNGWQNMHYNDVADLLALFDKIRDGVRTIRLSSLLKEQFSKIQMEEFARNSKAADVLPVESVEDYMLNQQVLDELEEKLAGELEEVVELIDEIDKMESSDNVGQVAGPAAGDIEKQKKQRVLQLMMVFSFVI